MVRSTETLREALETDVGSVAIQLQGGDHRTAVVVLRGITESVREAIPDGVARPRISPVAPLPDGPLLRIDDLPVDRSTRRDIAELVVSTIEDAGPGVGVLAVPELDGLGDLDTCRRAVVLRLFPPPAGAAGRIPPEWIDLAAEWVFGDLAPDAAVRLRVLGVERTVPAKDAAGVLHGCASARVWCDVVTGDVTSRVRTASLSFGIAPHVAVAGGGPRCDDAGLLARFDLLADVARECQDTAYVCLDFEETFGDLGLGLSGVPWAAAGGAPPNRVAGRLVDTHVPEVFPLQVLGPDHLTTVELETPELAEEGTPLDGDRWELAIGAPSDWLPGRERRTTMRQDAWKRWAPLLLLASDLDEALEAAGPHHAEPAERAHADFAGLPDVSSITIEPYSHPRRGTRLTVLELAAWLAGEPHTDAPTSVSPVLRHYVRELAVGIDADRRQELRPLASRLAATGASDDDDEQQRCWLLADRLLRVHAPAWLRAAGLTESADRLTGLGSIDADTQLVRGVDLLGSAVGTASRRLEITERIAGANAAIVDSLAWEAWEDVSQRSGWAAAADTVGFGLPGDLTFATDQRVMECSRDPEQRARLESSTRGLADEVWSTALQEIAATAWRSAWDEAESLVRHDTHFSVRVTMRRSLQSILPDFDDVTIEMLLDEVQHAARDTIARLILVGDDVSDYLHKGIDAASRVDGGNAWRQSLDETRRVLGSTLFDEAMGAARTRLGDWAQRAPRLVARAVVASITREACSVAGRGVAARAAAEAMARTGAEHEAEAAAREAMEPAIGPLADDSLALLEAMIDVSG